MRRWWVVIALLLSLGVNLGLVAAVATRKIAARPERPGLQRPAGEPLPRFRRLADHLGLEGEQRRQFLDLQRQLFEETVRVRMRRAESQREVRRELVSREPDQERIDALLQQSARDFLTLEQALAKNIVATRDILSPRQEREYLRIIARMRQPGAGGLGDRPERLGERPERLRERPERLRERPQRLRERPEKLGERPEKLGDRPDPIV